MKKLLLTAILTLIGIHTTTAQVGIGSESPEDSAQLELQSKNKGFLPPRLTFAQREAINKPLAGLVLWCSNCGTYGALQVYNGIEWTNFIGGTTLGANDIFSPKTGQIWMDRNLGASQVATSSTDASAFGDLYQWGRSADGHQLRTSQKNSNLSTTDRPGHGDFITINSSPYDWRNPKNDNLWQGVNGGNNPCPSNYRLPTEAEWQAEINAGLYNSVNAFNILKMPLAGYRNSEDGSLIDVGSAGEYSSSTVSGTGIRFLALGVYTSAISPGYRAYGSSVRCLKE